MHYPKPTCYLWNCCLYYYYAHKCWKFLLANKAHFTFAWKYFYSSRTIWGTFVGKNNMSTSFLVKLLIQPIISHNKLFWMPLRFQILRTLRWIRCIPEDAQSLRTIVTFTGFGSWSVGYSKGPSNLTSVRHVDSLQVPPNRALLHLNSESTNYKPSVLP